MIFWLWLLIGILVLILLFLGIKICLLKKAAREIGEKDLWQSDRQCAEIQ